MALRVIFAAYGALGVGNEIKIEAATVTDALQRRGAAYPDRMDVGF